MIPEGTDPAAIQKEQAQAVIQAVLDYIDANRGKITRSGIARNIGCVPSVLGQVLNWKYGGNWQGIVLELDRWLEGQVKRDAAPRTNDFVWTTVAQEIKTVADMAVTISTIGLVYGPTTSGLGKTLALRAVRDEKPGAIMITIAKAAPTPAGILRAIAQELRIGDQGGQAQLFNRIVQKLAGTSRLLIVDQVHSLCGAKDDKPLYILCDLFDATGAPQLWCGTDDLVAYLDRGQARGKESLAQIRRRIGISRDLMERTRSGGDGGRGEPLFTVDEIRAIFKRNKIRLAPDATQYLCTLANMEDSGHLGACTNLVRLATTAAEVRGETVLTAASLRAYHRTLVNGRAFSLLERRMSEYHQPIARVG